MNISLRTVFERYSQSTLNDPNSQLSPKQKKQKKQLIAETQSGLFLLVELLGTKIRQGRKATQREVQQLLEVLEKIPLERFPEVLKVLEQQWATLSVSAASQNTFRARLLNLFKWSKDQGYWPKFHQLPAIARQSAPKRGHGYGNINDFHVTERRGSYSEYRLKPEEFTPAIAQAQAQIFQFLTRPLEPSRPTGPISAESARQFLTDLNFFAGYLHHYEGVPLAELTPDQIIPTLRPEDLEDLSDQQKRKKWKEVQKLLEQRLCDYFNFMREEMQAKSPRTLFSRLGAFHSITRYLYRDWVETAREYDSLPIFVTLNRYLSQAHQEVVSWQKQQKFVADPKKKIPNAPEGMTTLEYIIEQVTEPLRQECAPRNAAGRAREPGGIAQSLMVFLQFLLLTLFPPRRQQDHRSLRIALTCPIERPPEVPADGVIYPLPPDALRERNAKGDIADNYLYKTYTYEGIFYPEGVWVMEITAYKTRKSWGVFSIDLANHELADGSHVYDYLERYLNGWWLPRKTRKHKPFTYDWWDPTLRGQRGRWVTQGRLEFEPELTLALENDEHPPWRAGYLFLKTGSGKHFTRRSDYAATVSRRAFRLVGKKITPHTMRYVWATWAFQVGLNDAELRALALMMGHSVDTLRKMYQRATPAEQQKHINRAIRSRLMQSIVKPTQLSAQVAPLLAQLRQLDHAEQMEIFAEFRRLLDADGRDSA
jgi:site-specific recombinase XerD